MFRSFIRSCDVCSDIFNNSSAALSSHDFMWVNYILVLYNIYRVLNILQYSLNCKDEKQNIDFKIDLLMEQSISMIATDSTCQFCFFKMVCLRQLDPQWSILTEKGLGSFLYSLYSKGLLSGTLATYQNQLPRFRMFQKKQPMNNLSQRLFHQFRDINTSYSVNWIY